MIDEILPEQKENLIEILNGLAKKVKSTKRVWYSFKATIGTEECPDGRKYDGTSTAKLMLEFQEEKEKVV